MNYHLSIKPLYDQLAKLTFTVQHQMKQHSIEDPSGIDVTRKTICNDLSLLDFKTNFESIVAKIEKSEKANYEKIGKLYKKELLEIVIHLDRMRLNLFGDGYKGNVLEIPEKRLSENEAYILGALDYRNVIDARETKEEFYKVIAENIDMLKYNLSDLLLSIKKENRPTKLEWNVKPALVAHLILELSKRDWITLPITNGTMSKLKSSELLWEIFQLEGTPRNFLNRLTEEDYDHVNKKLLVIPDASKFN